MNAVSSSLVHHICLWELKEPLRTYLQIPCKYREMHSVSVPVKASQAVLGRVWTIRIEEWPRS